MLTTAGICHRWRVRLFLGHAFSMIKHSQYDDHCEVKHLAGFPVFCQSYCDDKMIWSKKGHFINFSQYIRYIQYDTYISIHVFAVFTIALNGESCSV